MDAAEALAELTDVSSEIEAVAIADDRGKVVAATRGDGQALAAAGRALLEHAGRIGEREPVQVNVSTTVGSVFVVWSNGRTIVATTAPEPSAGLVFYDLRTCLGALEPKEPADET